MKNFIKTHRVLLLLLGAYALYASAATLKTWSAGESISSTDLNNNFSIVNTRSLAAKSAAAAAVATATNGPNAVKAFAAVYTGVSACTASPCTLGNAYNVSSVTRASAGNYTVVFSQAHARPMVPVVSSFDPTRVCIPELDFGAATTDLQVFCYNTNAAPPSVQADAAFFIHLVEP